MLQGYVGVLLDIPNRALFVHCKDFHFTGGMTYHHPNLTARYADVLHPRSDRDPCSVPWGVCGGGPGEGDGEEHLGVNSRGKWVMIDDVYRNYSKISKIKMCKKNEKKMI